MSALKYWIWLTTRGNTPGAYAPLLLEYFGSPEAAYAAGEEEYDQISNLPRAIRDGLCQKSLDGAEKILEDCDKMGLRLLTIRDTEYPERLRQISDPPCLLYVKGRLPRIDEEAAIAMVGARRCTPYGETAAGKLGLQLARQGALVVSGTARGIDIAALTGALRGGGKVVSVLGNGVDVIYPRNHQSLYEDVAAVGALLGEYPPGTPPEGRHFPVRNRIISGLSLGVVVVEADTRSGALITARLALDQGRDVFAVPGNIDAPMSRGTNELIYRGEAKLVRSADHILEEYRYLYPHRIPTKAPLPESVVQSRLEREKQPEEASQAAPSPEEGHTVPAISLAEQPEAFTDDEVCLLRALDGRSLTPDELAENTGIPVRRVLSALTMLQVRRMVREEPGKRFAPLVQLL